MSKRRRRARKPAASSLSASAGKVMASASSMRSGGYDAGSRTRRVSGWMPTASGPNAAYEGNLTLIRARSRHEVRNNAHARSAKETFVSDAIATGIVPRWKLEDTELAKKITAAFARWVDECDADGQHDFYGLQMLAAGTLFESGEVLIRKRRRAIRGQSVPLEIQILEPDYLDEMKRGDVDGKHFRSGVEFNAAGKRTAYWLHKFHPGDKLTGSFESQRVPADDIAHCYRMDRPGQVRGVPWLAPVLVALNNLGGYDDAELLRKRISASAAGYVKKAPAGEEAQIGASGEEEGDEERGTVSIEPGAVFYLEDGEEITFFEPTDVGSNYQTFRRAQLQAIAVGTSTTYEQLTGDLSGVNYSSIRAGLVKLRRWLEMIQHSVLVHQFCRPVINWWLDMAVASGVLDLPGYWDDPRPYRNVDWLPCAFDWVDPLKDMKAIELALKLKIETREAVLARRGYDVNEVNEAIAKDKKELEALGLAISFLEDGGPRSVDSESEEDDEDETPRKAANE